MPRRRARPTVPPRLREAVQRARRVLRGRRGLAAAYLFGSALTRSDYNDIDVALVLAPGARKPGEGELAVIALALDKAFRGETDLHLAGELPDAVLFRVVRDGVRFLTLDPLAAVRFEADTLTRFLDFKPTYDWLSSRILERQAW